MLKIETNKIGTTFEITLMGKLEVSNAARLEVEVKSILDKNPEAIGVDFERLRYIDSSGISTLLRCANLAKKSGVKFGCYNVDRNTTSIFTLSQVSNHINLTTKTEFLIIS